MAASCRSAPPQIFVPTATPPPKLIERVPLARVPTVSSTAPDAGKNPDSKRTPETTIRFIDFTVKRFIFFDQINNRSTTPALENFVTKSIITKELPPPEEPMQDSGQVEHDPGQHQSFLPAYAKNEPDCAQLRS